MTLKRNSGGDRQRWVCGRLVKTNEQPAHLEGSDLGEQLVVGMLLVRVLCLRCDWPSVGVVGRLHTHVS